MSAALAFCAVAVSLSACTIYGSSLNRPEEPVVLEGSSLPKLLGSSPPHIVGFSWDGSAWHQIPTQVDQRDLVNPGQILNRPTGNYASLPSGAPYDVLVYTNPAQSAPGYTWWPTYTGVASHSGLGDYDQVSFMENVAGQEAPAGQVPANVTASTQEQITLTDPLNSSQIGYVYLFASPTLTGGGAGTTGVSYTFSLDSGNYESTYHMGTGANTPNNTAAANPEQSTVVTGSYSQDFGDRWLNNGLAITADGASGTNILERGRVQFAPGNCGRSEDTFDDTIPTTPYEGGFVVNISGPVRAIRSYIGANSGQYTISTDIFYPQREDSVTNLVVHSIPGVMSFNDMETGVSGMSYSDSNNPNGVSIDGVPDTLTTGSQPPSWQMVSGSQGSLVSTYNVQTDISGVQASTYYLDQQPASPTPCTGDNTAWGQNGLQVTGPGGASMPCTDPTIYGVSSACPVVSGQSTANTFQVTRYRYFEAPNLSASAAANLAAEAHDPLQASVS